jgi:hypothetical protein
MENATIVVIIMTAVLVLALGAALIAFVIRPNLFVKEDDDDHHDRDDDDYYPDGTPRVRDIVRGVNDALQSGYDYDVKQDARIDKVSKDIDDIGKRVPPPPSAPTSPGTPAGTPAGTTAGTPAGSPAPGTTTGTPAKTPAPGTTAGSPAGSPAPGTSAGTPAGTPTRTPAGTPAGTPAPGTPAAATTVTSGPVSAKKEVFTSGGSSCAKFSYGASHAPGAKCGGSSPGWSGPVQGPPSGPGLGPAPAGGDAFDDASFSLPLASF